MSDKPIFKFAIREDLVDTGDLFLPSRATSKATGWDVKAAFDDRKSLTVKAGEHIRIPLGFRTFAPEGWWYELKPRSSTFGKKKLHSLYGTIDEDYEGQLLFACQYLPNMELDEDKSSYWFSNTTFDPAAWTHKNNLSVPNNTKLTIDFGEAIGQIIPVRRQEMKVASVTNEEFELLCKARNAARGTGGFGSSSK